MNDNKPAQIIPFCQYNRHHHDWNGIIWESTWVQDIEIGKTTLYDIFPPKEAARLTKICWQVYRKGPLFFSYEVKHKKYFAMMDYFEDGMEFVTHEVNYAPPMMRNAIDFLIRAMKKFYAEIWGGV